MTNKQIININVTQTRLGMKWTLHIGDRAAAGGYRETAYQALDAANDALADELTKVGSKLKQVVKGTQYE